MIQSSGSFLKAASQASCRTFRNHRRYHHAQNAKRHGWVSLVTIPLVHRGRPVGLLESYTLETSSFLKDQERRIKEMLRAFAHQTAEALYSAEAAKQSQIHQELNRLLTGPLELNAVLQVILSSALDAAGAHAAWLYLSDPDLAEDKIKRAMTHGAASERAVTELSLQDDLVGPVAKKGTAQVISDSTSALLGDEELGKQFRSRIAVPLRREEQTIGVLVAASRYTDTFSQEDVGLLGSFAQLSVLALSRARLMEHMRKVSESALRGREELAKSVVSAVHDLTGHGVCWWLVDTKRNELRIAAFRGVSSVYSELLPIRMDEEALATHALKTGEIINRANIFDPSVTPKFKYLKTAKEAGIKAVLVVPLFRSEGQPLGTLHVYRGTIGAFSSTEVDLVAGFANQVALALEQQQQAILQRVFIEVSQKLAASTPSAARGGAAGNSPRCPAIDRYRKRRSPCNRS